MQIQTELTVEQIDRILAERARALSATQTTDSKRNHSRPYLAFPIGEENFGIDVRYVQEIHPLADRTWSAVPGAPEFIVGAVNIRGRIYSLMNVARYLGIRTGSDTARPHVLLVKEQLDATEDPMEFGLLAEDTPTIQVIAESDLQAPSSAVSQKLADYLEGVTGNMLMIFNIQKLIQDPGIIVNEDV